MTMKLADYSQAVTVDQLDAALRAGSFVGVFHYIRGTAGWVRRIETAAVVAGIRARGWPQLGIDVPLNASNADGPMMAATARVYGFPAGSLMALDVEPSRFALDPVGWTQAADAWCDGVRAGGFSPGPYGTDQTTAACANRADWIWRAKPGECDPAGPGLADAFFTGHRIIQCSSGIWGGVEFDVSYSQFNVEVDMTPEQAAQLQRIFDVVETIPTDRVGGNVGDLVANVYEQLQSADGKSVPGGADTVLTAAAQRPVDVNAVAAALATHPLTASLQPADQADLALHLVAALAAQLQKP